MAHSGESSKKSSSFLFVLIKREIFGIGVVGMVEIEAIEPQDCEP